MRLKVRLKLRLDLYKNGKVVQILTKRVKDHLLRDAQVAFSEKGCSSGFLRVNYKHGVFNEIEVHNMSELKKALTIFTECELTKYLQS